MVYINPCLMLGSIVEVKRSDGTWEEGVIADIYNVGLGCFAEVTENDYFTVRFSDGRSKRILMQQEIELFIRPVHDTAGHVVSQMEVLENRKRARDSAKPVEAEDFAATQESQTVPVGTGLIYARVAGHSAISHTSAGTLHHGHALHCLSLRSTLRIR